MSNVLIITGLSLNVFASVILLIPNLRFEKFLEDERVVPTDQKKKEYFQIKDIKNLKLGVAGFVFFIIGFILQIVGILINIYR